MENKTGKYFKYAIGEIVLVVIGILIALQINNWNENRKSAIQENLYLKRLLSENKEDINTFKNNISDLEKGIESIARSMDCATDQSVQDRSLGGMGKKSSDRYYCF